MKLQDWKKKNIRTKDIVFWHRLFIAVTVLCLIPIVIISFYNHASADDFAFSNYPHHAWIENHNFISFFQGCIQQLHWNYFYWQGSFAAVILGTLNPLAFGEQYYVIGTFFLIAMPVAANFVFWRTLFIYGVSYQFEHRDRSKLEDTQSKMLADIVGCIAIIIQIELIPRALDMYFWWDGSVNYLPFFVMLMLVLAILIKTNNNSEHYVRRMVCVSILALLSTGGNYATALVNLLFYLGIGLWTFIKRFFNKEKVEKRSWSAIIIVNISSFAGLAISIFAPGNSIRMQEEGDQGISSFFDLVFESMRLAVNSIRDNTGALLFLLLALCIPFFWKIVKNNAGYMKMNRIPLLLWIIVIFCIYASSYAPTVYVYANEGPVRVEDVRYLYFVFFMMLTELLVIMKIYYCLRNQNEGITVSKSGETNEEGNYISGDAGRYLMGVVMLIIILAVGYYIVPRQNREILTSVCAARSLLIGEAQQYHAEMKDRDIILNDPATDGIDIIITPTSVRPYLLFLYGLEITEDSEYWINKAVATYYDKETVTLKSINE